MAPVRASAQARFAATVDLPTPPFPEEVNFRRTEINHELLSAFGDADKPIIITEGGWNDSLRWTNAVLPSERLRWTVEAYAMAERWDWLAAMCLWQFATPWSTHTYQDNWSFVAPGVHLIRLALMQPVKCEAEPSMYEAVP